MQTIKLLLLLPLLFFADSVFSQTNPDVVKVDSAMRNPGTPSPDTVKKDSVRLITHDTTKLGVKPVSKKDEVVKDSARLAIEKMPREAALRSAIFPGLGQIYNKRWWKVPLVYGGFVGIGLVYNFNRRYYRDLLKEAQYRDEHNEPPPNSIYAGYPDQSIIEAKDYYRRNRDLSILAGLAFYTVQIIDAYVDAKLFRYDISNDVTLRVQPSLQTQPLMNAYVPFPAIKLKISL